jgi:hypothetical protein
MLENKEILTILEKWSKKYKRSIDCSNPKGFSQKAHCAGRRKRKRGSKTKSRPVESTMENQMQNLKEFVEKEINETIQKEVSKKKLNESGKTLFEAVTLAEQIKKSNNKKKIELAESAVAMAELKLQEDFDEYEGDCDCGEGEGEMLKAQLMSIMVNAKKLLSMIDDDDQFEDWIQSKITIAEDYLRAAYGYMTYYNGGDEIVDDWDDNEDWDDIDMDGSDWEEYGNEFDGGGMDMTVGQLNYDEALDANVDDDEIFESKKSKKK